MKLPGSRSSRSTHGFPAGDDGTRYSRCIPAMFLQGKGSGPCLQRLPLPLPSAALTLTTISLPAAPSPYPAETRHCRTALAPTQRNPHRHRTCELRLCPWRSPQRRRHHCLMAPPTCSDFQDLSCSPVPLKALSNLTLSPNQPNLLTCRISAPRLCPWPPLQRCRHHYCPTAPLALDRHPPKTRSKSSSKTCRAIRWRHLWRFGYRQGQI